MKQVSIVIPAYNASGVISHLLEGCLKQDYPKDYLEIIVVDDGSVDNTKDIVKRYPATYLFQKHGGPAKSRNNGWRNAKGEIICFIDADCVPEPNWVSILINAYDSETIAGVGGTYDISNPESLLASCIHQEIVLRHLNMPRSVNYLGSFNVSYRKDVLMDVGGFNEDYKLASAEDNDLAYRIFKNGYRLVFEKKALVYHHYPEHLLKYLQQQFHHGIWRIKLYKDHRDMIKGDVYSGFFDYIQPPLAVLTIISLIFSLKFIKIFYSAIIFLSMYILLQWPYAIYTAKKNNNLKYLFLAIITFLRGFARGTGMLLGLLKFLIFVRQR